MLLIPDTRRSRLLSEQIGGALRINSFTTGIGGVSGARGRANPDLRPGDGNRSESRGGRLPAPWQGVIAPLPALPRSRCADAPNSQAARLPG